MGTKEETSPIQFVRGYHDAIQPTQVMGGKCCICDKPVYTGVTKNTKTPSSNITKFIHWGCK